MQGNTLDLVFSNCPDMVSDIHIRNDEMSDLSDHYIISLVLQQHSSSTCRSKVSSGNIFNYSKADWLGLEDFLLDADFSHCYSLPDVNSMWKCIKEIILQGCHQFIPKAHTKKLE